MPIATISSGSSRSPRIDSSRRSMSAAFGARVLLRLLPRRGRQGSHIARNVPSGGRHLQRRSQPLHGKVACPRASTRCFELALPALDSRGREFSERYATQKWIDVLVQTDAVAV